jgi:predicted nucleic-acid-binding Zn-ribbon protein
MANQFNPPTKCIKCGGVMESGAVVTNGDDSNVDAGMYLNELSSTGIWWKVEVQEEKGLLSGKRSKELMLVKPVGGPLQVLHYRCVECGYLESYAPKFLQ